MSNKTDRLVALFPDVYAARDRASLLYRLLDAIGAELTMADEKTRALLKSHWVNYAEGPALDGLGATFGVVRRRRHDEQLESDNAFRQRLHDTVRLFTGGGTKAAVRGAVRTALGMPFDLERLDLPAPLHRDLDGVVELREYSPRSKAVMGRNPREVELEPGVIAGELYVDVDWPSVESFFPQIEWRISRGGARRMRVARLDTGMGVESVDDLLVKEGETLLLSAEHNGRLYATVGDQDVSNQFRNLDETQPARLPKVPTVPSQWRFSATAALFDRGGANAQLDDNISRFGGFDLGDSFDRPEFEVWLRSTVLEPLTFDVVVPYFFQQEADRLQSLHGYEGRVLQFEGLHRDRIQEVVDQTRAAGVRGRVQFSHNLGEIHDQSDPLHVNAAYQLEEDAGADETFTAAALDGRVESHDAQEQMVIGAMYDLSVFDGAHNFL